ncbi:hypothetical protein Ct61P_14734 [Colletotrichum tofieldiae]|nr:hypothetical protein Ct61P_14734 [Colletotrichum tofieldiae]
MYASNLPTARIPDGWQPGELDADDFPYEYATKATPGPFCEALGGLGLAYVKVRRYWAASDLMLEGKPRGVQWDPSPYLRQILKNTPMVGNAGFTQSEAEERIREG